MAAVSARTQFQVSSHHLSSPQVDDSQQSWGINEFPAGGLEVVHCL